MKRVAAFVFGVVAYLTVTAVFAYFIGFVGGVLVPKTIDDGPSISVLAAVLIDLALVLAFGLQHSVMARQGFKRWWTRVVPQPVERSTFLLATAGMLALLCWQWRPIEPVIWDVRASAGQAALYTLFGAGWVLVLVSIHLMGATRFFGLRQVFDQLRRRSTEPPRFVTPALYRIVRHPIYVGLLLGFWSTPHMTAGHLLLSATMTGYILIGIRLEERDLVATFGDAYRRYRARVPMLVPRPGGRLEAERDEPSS